MPTYEYRCTSCGHRFDVFQRIDEDALTTCERCGGELRKVFHPAGIVFKGSGFYATDSRSAAKTSRDDSNDTKKDSKKDTKKADAADTKAAPKPSEKAAGSS